MPLQHAQLLSSGAVPKPDAVVPRPGGDQLAIGADGNAPNGIVVAGQRHQFLVLGEIPELDPIIQASGHEEMIVAVDHNAGDIVDVAGQAHRRSLALQVPHCNAAVGMSGDQQLAVQAEADGQHAVRISQDLGRLNEIVLDIPEVDLVLARDGEKPVVGAECSAQVDAEWRARNLGPGVNHAHLVPAFQTPDINISARRCGGQCTFRTDRDERRSGFARTDPEESGRLRPRLEQKLTGGPEVKHAERPRQQYLRRQRIVVFQCR